MRYAVLSNGAAIVDVRDGSLVALKTIPPPVAGEIIRIVREHRVIPAVYSADIHHQKIFYSDLKNARGHFFKYVIDDIRAEHVANILDYTGNVLQIGIVAEKEIVSAISGELAAVEATVIMLPFVDDTWLMQVVASDARKHLALRQVASMLNIPAGKLVAVGDNFNDSEMISNADIGVAMGNAPDEVKAQASVVVASNNDHGLAEVVDSILFSGAFFSEA